MGLLLRAHAPACGCVVRVCLPSSASHAQSGANCGHAVSKQTRNERRGRMSRSLRSAMPTLQMRCKRNGNGRHSRQLHAPRTLRDKD
eukprot:6214028-Pleurochrysis_carterae.AAC.1